MIALSLRLDEAWLIRNAVRQHQSYGQVWDREGMQIIHKAILYLESHKDESFDVAIEEGFAWSIEQQVPADCMTGMVPTGRNLLLKIMQELQADPMEGHDDDQPTEIPLPKFVSDLNEELERAAQGFDAWEKDDGRSTDKNDAYNCS